jgi:hypothetical protein
MMPGGPKGEKRPAAVIGAAVMIAKIATGGIEDSMSATKAAATLVKRVARPALLA